MIPGLELWAWELVPMLSLQTFNIPRTIVWYRKCHRKKVEIEGLIESWQLSDLQSDDKFENSLTLSKSDLNEIQWQSVPVQSSGVLNIGQYLQRSDGNNTGVVKLNLKSESKQVKQLNLGYSDFVRVYVNGQILYSGATNFISRDYRYLGTIGYFDSVYLPLKKGDNEVLFVVRENFGGWGLTGGDAR